MSIVVNVVSSCASWVVSDGRAKNNGKIITESQEKALMINKNVCVAFTGTLETAQVVVANLREHVIGIRDMQSDVVAKAISVIFERIGISSYEPANFLVTGVNSAGNMSTYTIGTQRRMQAYVPNNQEILHAVLHSPANTIDPTPYIESALLSRGLNNSAIMQGMTDYVKAVSEIDHSVNTNLKFVELRK